MGEMKEATRTSVLITGASGYVGRLVTEALAADPRTLSTIVATDVRVVAKRNRLPGVTYERLDITDAERLGALLEAHHVDTVVHLAAVVTPRPGDTLQLQYEVVGPGDSYVYPTVVASGIDPMRS